MRAGGKPGQFFRGFSLGMLLFGMPIVVKAHTGKGGARVDQQVTFSFEQETIEIDYTTRMNRPAAFLEFLEMDSNEDGQLSASEQTEYFQQLHQRVASRLELRLGGQEISITPSESVTLSMPFKKRFHFSVSQPEGWRDGMIGEFHNENYLNLPGKIVVRFRPGDQVDLTYAISQGVAASNGGTLPSPNIPRQRDLLFRYKKGEGNLERIADATGRFNRSETISASSDSRPDSRPPGLSSKKPAITVALSGGLTALVIALALFFGGRRRTVRFVGLSGTVVVLGLAAWYIALNPVRSNPSYLSPMEARQVFHKLHRQIYRAYTAADENRLYKILARGLGGELLDEVYTELYALSRKQEEGTLGASIRRLKPLKTEILNEHSAAGFRVRHRWRVYGKVTHYGHTHSRVNEYGAVYRMARQENGWRLTDSEVIQNKRVNLK